MTTWFSMIIDITLSKVQSKRGSNKCKAVFFDSAWYRPICVKFIDGIDLVKKGDWIKVRSNSEGNSIQMPAPFMRETDWTKWQQGELKWEHIALSIMDRVDYAGPVLGVITIVTSEHVDMVRESAVESG